MKWLPTILCFAGMLLSMQFLYGQEERENTIDLNPEEVPVPAGDSIPESGVPGVEGSLQDEESLWDKGNLWEEGYLRDEGYLWDEGDLRDEGEPRVTGDFQKINVRIPFSVKKSRQDLPFEILRENLRGDSADISIEPSELEAYRSLYPGLSILKAAPAIDNSDMATSLAEAMTFQKYPTYEQYDSMMHLLADTYPSICRIDTFGTSIEGRLLLALKLSDNVELHEDEPAFLYTATMHGDELVGYVLCLRLAEFLLANYGTDVEADRVINDVELWINPLSNPDGTFYPDNNNTVQASIRNNVDGINLNRDFPDPNSGEPDDTTGRAKETKSMIQFMKRIRPNLSANIHAGAEVVNYPWDHKFDRHPDNEWFMLISGEYADEAKAVNSGYLNLYASGITNGADWYRIYGGRQDYVTYYLQGRELTLELSNIKRLESEYLEDHWNYNKWSMINLVTQARYGIHGKVTDNSGKPLAAQIRIPGHDNDSSATESDPHSGNFYRYLKEGVYDLEVSSEGYTTDTIFGVEVFDYQKTELSVQMNSPGSGISSRQIVNTLQIFPNPTYDLIHIHTNAIYAAQSTLVITDLSGKTVLSVVLPAGKSEVALDISDLSSGTYMLKWSNEAQFGTGKIIIK